MTSEVCLMNRGAVVLAADSATTVTRLSESGVERRYFKGANKIFELSRHRPIGLMIFDSADILGVPWETIIKEFRSGLSEKSFNSVDGYAQEFFDFLNGNQRCFPEAVQDAAFKRSAVAAGVGTILPAVRQVKGEEKRRAAAEMALQERILELGAKPMPSWIEVERIEALKSKWRPRLEEETQSWLDRLKIDLSDKMQQIVDIAMDGVLKETSEFANCTGLVFAGFGDHDIFPSTVEYLASGLVDDKFVVQEKQRFAIDHEIPAWIGAFAQTSMSDTFDMGFSEDVYQSVVEAVESALRSCAEKILTASGREASSVPDLDTIIAAGVDAVSDRMFERSQQQHAAPLRRVLGVLPVDEMCELAETLINLQSLKEKVTKPSETVGGPVDVAVITKAEGLVWIKRKHYFDPSLNPNFFHRQRAVHR